MKLNYHFLTACLLFLLSISSANASGVAGQCGSLNGQTFGTTPTDASRLCARGTPSSLSGSGTTWTWTCQGSGTSANANCSATNCGGAPAVNGQCSGLDGDQLDSAPSGDDLCSSGTASAVSGSGPWSWTCAGRNGGSNDSCSATREAVVNGSCSSANGGTYANAAAVNSAGLCNNGNASPVVVSGDGPWSWSCNGSGGGSNSACNASQTSPPPPTACPSLQLTWAQFASKNRSYIFGTASPRARNNCPSGFTPTEIIDDSDPSRSLVEDNTKGGRAQLCMKTNDPSVVITSQWVNGSCPSGTVHGIIFDTARTDKGGYTDRGSKYYQHYHDFNEEEASRNDQRWCVGVTSPGNAYRIEFTTTLSSSCGSGWTKLFSTNVAENRFNVNTEDKPGNGSICARLQQTSGSCTAPAGGNSGSGGSGGGSGGSGGGGSGPSFNPNINEL